MKGMHHYKNKDLKKRSSNSSKDVFHFHPFYWSKRGNDIQRGEIKTTFSHIRGSKNQQKAFYCANMENQPHDTQCVILLVNDNRKLMPYYVFWIMCSRFKGCFIFLNYI